MALKQLLTEEAALFKIINHHQSMTLRNSEFEAIEID